MRGISVSLDGDLRHLNLHASVKEKLESRAREYVGNFIRLGSRMFKLPFRLPFVRYTKASYDLDTVCLDAPHIHLDNHYPLRVEKRILGYQLS